MSVDTTDTEAIQEKNKLNDTLNKIVQLRKNYISQLLTLFRLEYTMRRKIMGAATLREIEVMYNGIKSDMLKDMNELMSIVTVKTGWYR